MTKQAKEQFSVYVVRLIDCFKQNKRSSGHEGEVDLNPDFMDERVFISLESAKAFVSTSVDELIENHMLPSGAYYWHSEIKLEPHEGSPGRVWEDHVFIRASAWDRQWLMFAIDELPVVGSPLEALAAQI